MSKPFSLSKTERLKRKKDIDTLFQQGKAFFVFPYKVFYHLEPQSENPALLFGISVPKRHFKKAVTRNVLKRRSREAYRIQKVVLKEAVLQNQANLHLMLVYTHNEVLIYNQIAQSVKEILEKVQRSCGIK